MVIILDTLIQVKCFIRKRSGVYMNMNMLKLPYHQLKQEIKLHPPEIREE